MKGIKSDNDEEAWEKKKKLKLEQQWQERMNVVLGCVGGKLQHCLPFTGQEGKVDGEQDVKGMKSEDDEEAREKKKLGLEQQWQERMNGIREFMFQEGPLFQVMLPDTSTCSEVCTLPFPSLTLERPL